MPNADASLPSARARNVSRETPIMESRSVSRRCSSFSFCLRRNGDNFSSPLSLGAGEREDMEDAEETGVSLVSSAGKCPFADASSFFCVFDFAIKDLCKASSRAAYPLEEANIYWQLPPGSSERLRENRPSMPTFPEQRFCHDN